MIPEQKALRGLPRYVIEDYPNFVDFISAFYEWDSRNGFLTEEEKENLQGLGYSNVGVGQRSDRRWRDRNLERVFSVFETSDGPLLETSDGDLFENEVYLPTAPLWYSQFGDFPKIGLGRMTSYNTFVSLNDTGFKTFDGYVLKVKASNVFTDFRDLDDPRFIKLLRNLYMMKGSRKMIELFFGLFFGESVDVSNTKDVISRIDDNFVLDGANHLRDDSEYSEYTYVVKVSRDVELYKEAFENIFLRYFHPAGFNVILRRG